MAGSYRYPQNHAWQSAAELDLALNGVPAYHTWRSSDPGPGAPTDARFAALPVLGKSHLRAHGLEGFVSTGHDLAAGLTSACVETVTTSGSTDEKVVLTWNQTWWNASEAASWQLNSHAAACGLGDHREAILASPRSVGVAAAPGASLSMAQRQLGRFLYLNDQLDATAWTDGMIRRMVCEMEEFQPVVLEANPTLLARLARRAEALGLSCWQPRLIVFSFEFPSRVHLRSIRRLFERCAVMSSYGCTEAGCVLTQCEAGCFHQNSAFVRVEFQPLAARFDKPRSGQAVLTSFGNPWRVLLRFQAGDLVRLRPPGDPCPCGRTEGMVADAIEGRVKDLTFDCRGFPVTVDELDCRVAEVPGVLEYQVEQASPTLWSARAVCESDAARTGLREALASLYGSNGSVIRVDAVPAEVSGKHRLSRSGIAPCGDLFGGPVALP